MRKSAVTTAASFPNAGHVGTAFLNMAATAYGDNARAQANKGSSALERNPIGRRFVGGWKGTGSQAGAPQGKRETERRRRQMAKGYFQAEPVETKEST